MWFSGETRGAGESSLLFASLLFAMMRALTRVILLVLVGCYARAESLDDAARALAKKIQARLGPTETARVASRNLSSLPASEAAKAQAALERALARRVRNPMPVDILLTFSENVRGLLLVTEIRRESGTEIDLVEFRLDPAPVSARPELAIEKKQIWQQAEPILDVAVVAGQMLVLDGRQVVRYERNGSKWELMDTAAFPPVNLRDPRGRLEVAGDAFSAEIPGEICKGTWKPALTMQCEQGGRFSAARNTLDLNDGRGPFFQQAELGGVDLVAELDGHTRIYDAAHNLTGVFEGWGSDLVAIADACGGKHVAGSAPGDRQAPDSIALYDLVNGTPVRVSEPAALPGPVTALWSSDTGALAVARNLSTGTYEAYALSIDCGR
jgi:hypothetical protein